MRLTRPVLALSSLFRGVAIVCGALAPALALSVAPAAMAAEGNGGGNNGSTITVTGAGDAKGRPTLVEMSAVVSGEAELAADAVVKFKDTRRRAVKAIEDLKIPSLAIESKGFTLNQGMDPNQQQMMMRGQMPTTAKQRVQVTEPLRLVIKGVDKMSDEELMNTVLKVIDAGRDAGLTVGGAMPQNYYQMQMMMQRGDAQGMASFKIENAVDLREKAYAKAIDDARAKAERLARLAGVKLGKVTSVQDGVVQAPQAQVVYVYGQQQQAGAEAELTSPVAGDITLNVRLTIQFAIE
jgi:uncharacterized protein YggE